MSKVTNFNAQTVFRPSSHGCGYAYDGGCACQEFSEYSSAGTGPDQ